MICVVNKITVLRVGLGLCLAGLGLEQIYYAVELYRSFGVPLMTSPMDFVTIVFPVVAGLYFLIYRIKLEPSIVLVSILYFGYEIISLYPYFMVDVLVAGIGGIFALLLLYYSKKTAS